MLLKPFLALLLGEPALRTWASRCPGPLGHTGMPTPAPPVLAAPSPRHGGTMAAPGNSRAWLPSAPLSLMRQVASSCLRCCTLRPSLPVGSLPHPCPRAVHHTFSPGPGLFTSNLGSRLAFTSGILSLWKRGPLGFPAASRSAVPPSPLAPPEGGGGAGREFSQSSLLL